MAAKHHTLRVLIASTTEGPSTELTAAIIARLSKIKGIEIQLIAQPTFSPTARTPINIIRNIDLHSPIYNHTEISNARYVAAELCEWADVLLLAPLDADTLARFLMGLTENLLLEVMRSWDVSKKITMVLAMSKLMWENPMSKKQISKIRRKYNHIRCLEESVLWSYEKRKEKVEPWNTIVDELVAVVQNQADLANVGRDLEIAPASLSQTASKKTPHLPPELWSIIIDYTSDWELAKRLDIYTTLPTPLDWQPHNNGQGQLSFGQRLEWILLTGTLIDVKNHLNSNNATQRPSYLSRLSVKLIMRFAMTDVLSYLERSHKELHWNAFGHAFLPDKASFVFGQVKLLDYWRTSPAFLNKEYTYEAIDGASRAGFVHVLDWWYKSGLPLRYTEAALEQATSNRRLDVLEWWKNAGQKATENGRPRRDSTNAKPNFETPSNSGTEKSLILKPGKSISYAAQAGSIHALRWWVTSNIPFQHEDSVAKLSSNHGHIAVLDLWKSLRGSKMIFDNQVLVGATKNGHRDVLEWWKKSRLRVEYKTCDIEEALEDGSEGPRGEAVRRWWAENGLNLGVGTSEWMRTKVLN